MSDWQVFPAPAKLNLFLHVVGRRADGYHLLQTAFRFLAHYDEIHLRVRDDGVLRRVNEVHGVPAESDLALRAARLLQEHTGCRFGAELRLEKRLPLGGGLGGGSSDAATVLIALNRLWKLGCSREQLQSLALRLGADVPVFVYGRNAFAEGVGERLQMLALQPAWYLVLQPQVSVSTAEIFSDPQLTRYSEVITIAAFLQGPVRNDLEPIACRRYPEVGRHLAWLRQHGKAAMTGSGACVFSEFETETEARRVLREVPAGMTGFVAQGLDRHPLYREDEQ